MDTFASAALLFLGLIAFNNYKNGTLPEWLKAKFLNSGAPIDEASPFELSDSVSKTEEPATVWASIGGTLGNLLTPVVGKITGVFGEQRATHKHAGIDYAVPIGTSVAAASSGVVAYAGNMSGYGLTVDIDHGGGNSTRYAHLSSIPVRIGQKVTAGQTIGLSGNTGNSTGPHLHFELRDNGKAVDPSPYFNGLSSGRGVVA